jgi:hypothetical protein
MYCNVEEAYDNSLKQQFKALEKTQQRALEIANLEHDVSQMQTKLGIVPPHMMNSMYIEPNKYNPEEIGLNPDYVYKKFYDAQGDVIDGKKLQGTSLNELNSEISTMDSMSESDSNYSDNRDSLQLSNNESDMSLSSFNDSYNKNSQKIDYKKIAKQVIHEIIEKPDNDSDSDENIIIKKIKKKHNHNDNYINYNHNTELMPELKELVLVIIIGIFVIITIDFFIRIGRLIK